MDEVEVDAEATPDSFDCSERRRSLTWRHLILPLLLGVPYVAAITWLDMACFFQIVPFYSYASVLALSAWLALHMILTRDRASQIVAVLALLWLFALPYVPWHDVKVFFIDANSLRRGMTVDEVEEIMAAYPVFGPYQSETSWRDLPDEPFVELREGSGSGRLEFHAGWPNSDETCYAVFAEGVVTETRAHKD